MEWTKNWPKHGMMQASGTFGVHEDAGVPNRSTNRSTNNSSYLDVSLVSCDGMLCMGAVIEYRLPLRQVIYAGT